MLCQRFSSVLCVCVCLFLSLISFSFIVYNIHCWARGQTFFGSSHFDHLFLICYNACCYSYPYIGCQQYLLNLDCWYIFVYFIHSLKILFISVALNFVLLSACHIIYVHECQRVYMCAMLLLLSLRNDDIASIVRQQQQQ